MKLVHLRHAQRDSPSRHINGKGLITAQKVGKTLGIFDLILSSVSTRAVETSIAMGYPINDTIDFSTTVENITEAHQEMKEGSTYSQYFAEYQIKKYVFQFGNNCKKLILDKIRIYDLNEIENILLVSHGGVIEVSTVAFLGNIDYSNFGNGAKHCGGVQIVFDKNLDIIGGDPFKHEFI